MKFLLDASQETVREKSKTSSIVLGQLLTPLTRFSDWGGTYAIDNGAFSGFQESAFKSLLKRQEHRKRECLFVTCPDIVGSAQRTLELFSERWRWISNEWKVALVAQDGMESKPIPWDSIGAIFIGGKDPWKDSDAAADIVKTAKIFGKWVHVGRVNTPKRFDHFAALGADSCDGSGVAKYDHMLEAIENRNERPLFSKWDEHMDLTLAADPAVH